ncbi:MAG: PTS sugar transporter subunit IIA [Candidatus Wenzhouxiangella sp. M2_3B_020]
MTGIVVVAHAGLGEALCAVAEGILGRPAPVTVIGIRADADPDDERETVECRLAAWPADEPPLVLTDLPGATPHNLAEAAVARACPAAPVVTGLNLPMLLRALNHAARPAAELADVAAEGAHAAVFVGEKT